MKTHLKKSYLEQIRNTRLHWKLRLTITVIAVLASLGVVGATLIVFNSGRPWLALYNLASLAVIYVLRSLAILVVDIADMLLDQAVKTIPHEDQVAA